MEWKAELVGREEDINNLQQLFSRGPMRIADFNGRKVLEADAFNGIADRGAVKLEADRLLKIMGGAADLYYPGRHPVTCNSVMDVYPDGSHGVTVFPDVMRIEARMPPVTLVLTDANGDVIPQASPREQDFAHAAASNPAIQVVFENMGLTSHNFNTLFKIYEVIEKDKESRKKFRAWVAAKGITTEDEVLRLSASIQDPGKSGSDARHALPFDDPHPGPAMEIEEARRLLYEIARAWLEEKVP